MGCDSHFGLGEFYRANGSDNIVVVVPGHSRQTLNFPSRLLDVPEFRPHREKVAQKYNRIQLVHICSDMVILHGLRDIDLSASERQKTI